MKRFTRNLLFQLFTLTLLISNSQAAPWMDGMKEGKPSFKSMGPLAFGPEGILFIADTKAASVFAVATGDVTPDSSVKSVNVEAIDQKIAALLGTTPDQI